MCNKAYRDENKERRSWQKKSYYRSVKGLAKGLFGHAAARADQKGLDFSLEREWIEEQIRNNPVCPIRGTKFIVGNGRFHKNSRTLDRIRPNLGYTKENVVLVSFKANLIKNNGTLEEIFTIVKHLKMLEKMKMKSWVEKFNVLNLEHQNMFVSRSNLGNKINVISQIVTDAKKRAKRKGLEFNILREDILTPAYCPILGIPLQPGKGRKIDNSPTLDRIDNNKGYVSTNIQIISNKANIMKNDCSVVELKNIYENYSRLLNK